MSGILSTDGVSILSRYMAAMRRRDCIDRRVTF
jgi:hypothetical protein